MAYTKKDWSSGEVIDESELDHIEDGLELAHTNIDNHLADTDNPHSVDNTQVGLGNVTNDAQVKRDEMGVASGVATLDEDGLLPQTQLPDDLDADNLYFTVPGDNTPEDHMQGKIRWSATCDTLVAELGRDVDMQIGQEDFIYIQNNTGQTIYSGDAVYVAQTVDGVMQMELASTTTFEELRFAAIVTSTIPNGEFGHVTIRGEVHGCNTSAWNVDDSLYISSTPGVLTNVKPSSGELEARVGRVLVSGTTDGVIYVNVWNTFRVEDLADVEIITPVTDEILTYNGTAWVNGPRTKYGVGTGVAFYLDSTPIIEADTDSQGVYTLSKSPITDTEEFIHSITITNETALFERFKYNTELGGTTIDGGDWNFNTYCYVDNNVALSEILVSIHKIMAGAGTVTITGTGTSRTATVTGGTPFIAGDASADVLLQGLLETPNGVFEITGYTSSSEVTIQTLTTYVNESDVSYEVWRFLFTDSATEVNQEAVGLTSTAFPQAAYGIAPTDKLGASYFAYTESVSARTLYLYHNGTAHYTNFETPIIMRHNDLAGVQGGDTGEYYHLTLAEYQLVQATSGVNTGDETANSIVTLINGSSEVINDVNIAATLTRDSELSAAIADFILATDVTIDNLSSNGDVVTTVSDDDTVLPTAGAIVDYAVPITDVYYTGDSGDPVSKIPYIKSDGVIEISRYIDMHMTGSSEDYDARIQLVDANTLRIDGVILQVGANNVIDAGDLQTTLTDTDAYIPTSGAIVDYVASNPETFLYATDVTIDNLNANGDVVTTVSDDDTVLPTAGAVVDYVPTIVTIDTLSTNSDVVTTITDDDTVLPTAGAIVDYVASNPLSFITVSAVTIDNLSSNGDIVTTISDSDTALPTAGAVVDYAIPLTQKDVASGVASLNSDGNLVAPSQTLYLTRNASNNIFLADRTSTETAFYLHRDAASDYTGYIKDGGSWEVVVHAGNVSSYAVGAPMPPGSITAYAGSTTPSGWLLCNGAAVSRTTYSDLYSAIGTNYGVGDGSTTFNLPDMQGNIGVGIGGSGVASLGDTGGEQEHTLTTTEMPAHTHTTTFSRYGLDVATGRAFGNSGYYIDTANVSSNSTGGGSAHNNMPPYVGVNYIIKT